jgi:hypothetical protein
MKPLYRAETHVAKSVRMNQLAVSVTGWQRGSQICFVTYSEIIKKLLLNQPLKLKK